MSEDLANAVARGTFRLQNLSGSLSVPDTTTPVRNRLGAGYLLERHIGIIGTLEPIKAPLTTRLQLRRETITLRA
jgi:hypothetical protein